MNTIQCFKEADKGFVVIMYTVEYINAEEHINHDAARQYGYEAKKLKEILVKNQTKQTL